LCDKGRPSLKPKHKRMKNLFKITTAVFLLMLVLMASEVLAGVQPPDPGGDPSGSGIPVGGGAPVGHGIGILLSLSIVYMLWKMQKLIRRYLAEHIIGKIREADS